MRKSSALPLILVVFALFLMGSPTAGHSLTAPSISWGPNTRVNTDTAACNPTFTNCAQHEPDIAVNPRNDMNAITIFKDWRDGYKQDYLATTFDGGQTWSNQLPNGLHDLQIAHESDPVVIFGADGTAYVSMLCYGGPDEGPCFTKSGDGGKTWSKVSLIWRGGPATSDKEWIAVDSNPASPYYNRLYASWSYVKEDKGRFYAAYSSDGGVHWSAPATLNHDDTLWSQPLVLPNGNVLVIMYYEQSNQMTEVRSTDGGQTWSAEQHVVAVGTIDANCEVKCPRGAVTQQWRVDTIPSAAVDPRTGAIHLVWLDDRNEAQNGWDIYYSHSTDGGNSWSDPRRLNDDPPGKKIDQVIPVITVGNDGTVHAAWMDKRDDPNNVLLNLYYTYSSDGGATWQPDQRLSSAPSDYNVGIASDAGNAAGDYMGISATASAVWLDWTDTRNGQEDIYAIRGAISGTNAPPPPALPTSTPAAMTPPQQANPNNPFTFAETGKTIGGAFRQYWESHGGLAQQGYPLSNEFAEVSALNGETYTVQYFERAVFEYHPENAAPNDVLLSQLGTFRYKQKYPSGVPNQQASTANPYTFAITGYTIGGKFRAYWESNGGLAQFGYPISDQFQELSTLDGKTYTVQYFERAVMELHPENAGTPYEVELSQLGAFQYHQKYPAMP